MIEQDITLLGAIKDICIGVCFMTGAITIVTLVGDYLMKFFIGMCKWVAERTK
jgi:hypothetical protein